MPKKSLREEVKDLRRQLASLQERLETIEEVEEEHPARIMTYIEGFDDLIGGGIPKGHVCLLSGPSGTMKTTIALNMLCNNSKNGLKALYITLEETKESLIETTGSLCADFDSDFIVDIGRLRTEHEEVEETGKWIDVLKAFISKRKRYRKIELLAIDSLTALYSLADLESPHRDMFHLFAFLRDLDITTLFISDLAANSRFPNREDSIADGAIQ